MFVPGTTYAISGKLNGIAFMPNLRDEDNKALTSIDFDQYEIELKTLSSKETGINVDKEHFKMVVTKDLGGTGIALGRMLAQKNMLKEGDYIMGVMTGGGFGSVDIKVKNIKKLMSYLGHQLFIV